MLSPRLVNILRDWKLWPNICQSQPDEDELTPLNEGLTNENWLLRPRECSSAFVIRCNAENQSNFYINRQHERGIHQAISNTGLCPAVIYENTEKQYWIRPYISGNTLDALNFTTSLLEQCIGTLKAVHEFPLKDHWPVINLNERINWYWSQLVENTPDNIQKLTHLKKSVDQIFQLTTDYQPVLCHMDCNTKNWIINQDKVSLIDWEYAHIGNPAWDLAIFCDSAKLNKQQTKHVINTYGDINQEQLHQASKEMQYLETLWFAIKLNQTYEELEFKLKALLK